jgi:hypothetical protein
MKRVLFAALVACAAPAVAQSALERAYADVVAARAALERAQEAKRAGEEPGEGERQGIVTPPGKQPRSRLSDAYWQRQKRLDDDLAQARGNLDDALRRWNALK